MKILNPTKKFVSMKKNGFEEKICRKTAAKSKSGRDWDFYGTGMVFDSHGSG